MIIALNYKLMLCRLSLFYNSNKHSFIMLTSSCKNSDAFRHTHSFNTHIYNKSTFHHKNYTNTKTTKNLFKHIYKSPRQIKLISQYLIASTFCSHPYRSLIPDVKLLNIIKQSPCHGDFSFSPTIR